MDFLELALKRFPIPPHPRQMQRIPHLPGLAFLLSDLAQLAIRLRVGFTGLDPFHKVCPVVEDRSADLDIARTAAPQ